MRYCILNFKLNQIQEKSVNTQKHSINKTFIELVKRMNINNQLRDLLLTLSCTGGPFRPPLSENRDCSRTEPLLDLRPFCKFKFVCCGPVEKTKARYLSRFSRCGPTKFESTFFRIAKLRF